MVNLVVEQVFYFIPLRHLLLPLYLVTVGGCCGLVAMGWTLWDIVCQLLSWLLQVGWCCSVAVGRS